MNTIICQTNYCPIAANALHYAQSVALHTHAEIVYLRKPLTANLFRSRQVVLSATNSIYLSKNATLQSQSEFFDPTHQLQTVYTISEFTRAKKGNMVILGVEKEFGIYDMYSESIVNLLNQAQCPALFIPEGATFKPFKRIVVVIDHEIEITHRIELLLKLASLFQAEIFFLQIKGQKYVLKDALMADFSTLEDDYFESMKSLYLSFPYQFMSFHKKVQGSIPEGIAEFITHVKADLVVTVPYLQAHEPFSYATFCKQYAAKSLAIPLLAIDSQPVGACKSLLAFERTSKDNITQPSREINRVCA